MQSTRKNILFYSGIFLALIAGLVELLLLIFIIKSGEIDLLKGVTAAVNGGVVFGTTKMLIEAWRANFLVANIINLKDLGQCHTNRLQVVKLSGKNENQFIPDINRQLITQYLALLEGVLQQNLGKHHYELSVFCGAEFPEIISYYDTNRNTVPRSKVKREQDKNYYINKKYEVVELLRNPSTRTQYIENTLSHSEDYSFTSEEQKNKVRSTILHCVDINWPSVIVITCDKEKVLGANDEFREAFLAIYTGIATDLYLGSLINLSDA